MKNNSTIIGITLRDIFAAISLHSLLNIIAHDGAIDDKREVYPSTVSKAAYEYADAMLAARVAKED